MKDTQRLAGPHPAYRYFHPRRHLQDQRICRYAGQHEIHVRARRAVGVGSGR